MFNQQICCWSDELDWAIKKVKGGGARIDGEKVKSDIESVKVAMHEVRYKLSLCSNIRTSLQNRTHHNLWNISFSVSSS